MSTFVYVFFQISVTQQYILNHCTIKMCASGKTKGLLSYCSVIELVHEVPGFLSFRE